MKLIRTLFIIVAVILFLNYSGMLNDDASKKVDNIVEDLKTKINELEYKDKLLTDMTLKEISNNISADIKYLKEDVISDDGLILKGDGIKTTINPTAEIVLKAEVDATKVEAVESIEKLLYNLTKMDIKIPQEVLEKGNFTILVEKVDGEYSISFN